MESLSKGFLLVDLTGLWVESQGCAIAGTGRCADLPSFDDRLDDDQQMSKIDHLSDYFTGLQRHGQGLYDQLNNNHLKTNQEN